MALQVIRCPATHGATGARTICDSAVFYDWGIKLMESATVPDIRGGSVERFNNFAETRNVQICVRCSTPYIVMAGELIDISEELSDEDVKLIISRGQATQPHPAIKDP